MSLDVQHRQNKTSLTGIYQRSPAIWATCPLSWIKKFYPEGHVRWDASKMSLKGTQTAQIAGPIGGTKVFGGAGGSVDAVSAVNSVEKWGGAIRFLPAADNDAAALAQAYPTFRLSGLPASSNRLWFEGCVAINSLLTNTLGFFMGLAETEQWTLAAGVPFNAGDAITNSASAIGFRKGEDALGVVDTVVSDRAISFTNIGASEGSISAAYTFAKFGFMYDPGPGNDYNSSAIIRFFQDNLELTTKVSKTTLTGYTNLDANALGPIFATIADSGGAATECYLKWLEVAQLPPGINP
jgi:hypothetical protein